VAKRRITRTLLLIGLLSPLTMGEHRSVKFASMHGRVTDLFGEVLNEPDWSGVILKLPQQHPGKAKLGFYHLDVTDAKGRLSVEGKLVKTAYADAQGSYRADQLPGGQYRIEVDVPNYGSGNTWFVYVADGEDLTKDIGVPLGYTHTMLPAEVTGAVMGPGRKPVVGATVTLINAFDVEEVLQTTTDADGKYSFRSMSDGQFLVYASKPGFLISVNKSLVVKGRHVVDFDLSALPAPGTCLDCPSSRLAEQ
jgi:hypothetical protein